MWARTLRRLDRHDAAVTPQEMRKRAISATDRSVVGIIRHPADDGLVDAAIAAFDGFWQCQFLNTGSPVHPCQWQRRAERQKC